MKTPRPLVLNPPPLVPASTSILGIDVTAPNHDLPSDYIKYRFSTVISKPPKRQPLIALTLTPAMADAVARLIYTTESTGKIPALRALSGSLYRAAKQIEQSQSVPPDPMQQRSR